MDTPTIRTFIITVTLEDSPADVRIRWSYHLVDGTRIHSITDEDGQDVLGKLSQADRDRVASETRWAAASLSVEERQAEFLRHYKSRGAHSHIKALSADQHNRQGAA
jgi:hypothetical protein